MKHKDEQAGEIKHAELAERCIDAHLHVDLYPEGERRSLLEEAFQSGVEAAVAVSMHLDSCKVNAALSKRYPGQVHPAYGFHPEQELPADVELERLFRWIDERYREGEAFAIGEVGLPYYMGTERESAGGVFDEEPYLLLLERFVKLAAEWNRPIVLHAVYEDADKACDLLQRYGARKAHFHWFKGGEETVRRMIEAGYYISITPDVAYEAEIISLVERYPIELMMVETDGPWPFEGPYSGERTKPSMAKLAAADVARIKGLPVEEAQMALLRNTRRFYNL